MKLSGKKESTTLETKGDKNLLAFIEGQVSSYLGGGGRSRKNDTVDQNDARPNGFPENKKT